MTAVDRETFPDRTAWLEARRHGIGASEAADVLGIGRKSPIALYAEKLGLSDPDPVESEEAEWGLLVEPILVQRYQRVTGRMVDRPTDPYTIIRSREHPFMTFSPDGFVYDAALGEGPLQIKNVGPFHADAWDDEPPLAYQVQVQHEIRVMGARWGALAVLLGGNRFRHYVIPRHESFQALLVAREGEFWRRLTEQDPPAVDGSEASRELLRKLYPRESPGLVVNLPADAIEWDARRRDGEELERRGRAMKAEAENKIKAALGEAECGVLSNGVSFTWKASERKGYTVEPTVVRTLRRKVDLP